MSKVIQLLQGKAKWRVFWLIMIVIVVVSAVLSAVARFTLVEDNLETRPRLALVVPTKSPTGMAMQKGAQLFLDQLARDGGISGRRVELMVVEEGADAPAKVMADKRVIGVVGYLDAELLKKAAPQYEKAKLRVVTPLQLAAPLSGVTSLGLDPREESRFAANYARNIQQRRLMYVIREEGADFDALVEPLVDVYQRFDTPVKQVWTLPAGGNEAKQKEIIAAVKDIDVGAIYIATRPELAARLVHSIRGTGNALDLFGPSALATVLRLVSQQPERRLDWIAALCVTMLISAVVLVSAERIQRLIGSRLVVAVERLMGLVLVSVAIEMMLRGAKTFALQVMGR